MRTRSPIAIVGGGPAGALAAARLAGGGRDVVLFDEKLAWEKPCGGGITHKALQQYPFLAEALGDNPDIDSSSINCRSVNCRSIDRCEIVSPSGRHVSFRLQYPVAIFSRLALNGLLLERARSGGAVVHQERVTGIEHIDAEGKADRTDTDTHKESCWQLHTPQGEYRASYLILAAGARNPFRSQFVPPIAASDLMITAGYFIPGCSSLMQIQFLKSVTGYIWVFPRADHVSAGIAGKMGEVPAAELRRMLEQWLGENGFNFEGARFFSHILPSFRAQTFESLEACGDGWAMIGDSAGLVDPITGEGLYYALRSAELCADTLLAGQPEKYASLLDQEVLAELKVAARVSQRFYRGEIFGDSVLDRMVSLTAQSASFRDLMSDLFAGIQGYRDLRARLCGILPAVMAETLRQSWSSANSNSGSKLLNHLSS